jgi:hypothetical protein
VVTLLGLIGSVAIAYITAQSKGREADKDAAPGQVQNAIELQGGPIDLLKQQANQIEVPLQAAPVGTVIASARPSSPTPQKWLLCDGRAFKAELGPGTIPTFREIRLGIRTSQIIEGDSCEEQLFLRGTVILTQIRDPNPKQAEPVVTRQARLRMML